VARDQVLVDLYKGLLTPFPAGLAGKVIEGVDLVDLDDGIGGAASHYVNNTRPLNADHRAWLQEYLADLDQIDAQLPDEYAREYFARLGELARYLLATR
jgi:hypothetical protein